MELINNKKLYDIFLQWQSPFSGQASFGVKGPKQIEDYDLLELTADNNLVSPMA